MKKVRLTFLALLMVATLLAGCTSAAPAESSASSESTVSSENASESTTASGDEIEPPEVKTVGVIIWATDDVLSASVKRLLDYAGEALNIELVYKTGDFDTESQVKAAENLVAAGVDGIICCPFVDSGIPKIFNVCKDAGIPYVQMFRKIVDTTNAEEMEDEPLWLGYSVENEEVAGKELLQILVDAGAENIACIYLAPGNTVCDARKVGIEEGFAEGLANKIAEVELPTSPDSQNWIEATKNFINTYPELDGIIMSSGAVGGAEGTIATIESLGKTGTVKMATFDQPANADVAFENGILVGLGTGMYTDPLYSFIIMANYLQGNPLSDSPVKINTNYIWLTNEEDNDNYSTYVDGEGIYPYTVEEIRNMTKYYNPDFTQEDLQEIASDWTMENAVAKQQGY